MKIKTTIAALAVLITGASVSEAAILAISNIGDLTSDTLYADRYNNLMSGGAVTIGYFAAGITNGNVDTIPELYANLSNFTVVSTATIGAPMAALGGLAIAGYADNTANLTGAIGGNGPASIGQLTTGNVLIGRNYYSIITNFSSLAAAAAAPLASNELYLVLLGQLPNEDAGELSFISDPATGTIMCGILGSKTVDLGFGLNTYATLTNMPEPSTALLGAIGALGLLRRRRI